MSASDDRGDRFRSSFRGVVERGSPVTLRVDGVELRGYAGETVAAAMMAAGIRSFRRSVRDHVRGVYCGMGVCYECLVDVDGQRNVRACMTYVADGMTVERPGMGRSTAAERPDGERP